MRNHEEKEIKLKKIVQTIFWSATTKTHSIKAAVQNTYSELVILERWMLDEKVVLHSAIIQITMKFKNNYKVIEMLPKSEPFRPNVSKMNESIRTRSLVDATGQQILQFSQQEINFVNTELNQLYEISFTIRNVSPISQKIKIKKPNNPAFALQISREGPLAAGLEMKVTVVFDSKENQVIKDKIVIFTDTSQIQIPLNVFPNAGKLQFEPFINFGFVKTGTTKTVSWEVSNKSETVLKIKLQPLLADQAAKLTLSQQQLNLEGGAKRNVMISLSSIVSGLVEGSIEIQPKGINYSTLEFTANFCDFSRLISDSEGKQLHQILLEPLFGGQTVSTNAFLVNNTPETCEFKVTRKKGAAGDESISLATPEQVGRDDSQKLVQFTPSQGELEAYSSTEIKSVVMAKYQQSDFQLFCNYILGKNTLGNFEKDWTYTLRVYLNHDDSHLDLPIRGTSLIPKLAVTPTYLSFSNTILQQKQKKTIKLQNFSTKAVNLQFQNSANYSFFPQKLKIASKESSKVLVVFSPKIMGELNEICCLNSGVFSFPIKLLGKGIFGNGKAESHNMTCQEVPIENFQGSIIEQQISIIPKQRNSMQPGATMDISKNSIHFDTYRHAVSTLSEQKSLNQENQKKIRTLHNKSGKEMKFDVNHLNANQPVDTYPSTAKNQQEERLISRELSSHELRNISVGPVLIDMGTIFLRSTLKKYFHICNFNPKPISIKLEANHQSFAQTSEQRQILPAESHGGFTILYEALSQGPFKYTLQYVLNGCHFFDLMVTGTCISPTLTLSRNEVKFIINQQDRKFEKRESIKLENNYDYDVSFEWKTQPNSPFSLQPTSGIVKANSFISQSIVYSFEGGAQWGVKLEQSLKLRIKYGKQIQVRCSAFMPQSQCISKAQEINFKQVAVGRVCDSKILVKNLSKISTIYKILIPKELQNILTIQSKLGSIAAEEMIELIFKLNSLKTMILDSSIQILIRGSKPIDLPVKANVILPQVYIENQQIDFGNIPVQSNPAQKEVTLINQSNIQVDLELRLHYDTFLAKNLKLSTINDSNLSLIEIKQSKNFRTVCLRINPKCKANFILEFIPETAQEYEFYLPLFIPNTEPIDNLQRRCICKGIKNRLMALSKQVAFGKTVIEQNQIFNKNQTLQIYNPQQQPISWWIEESGLAPFRVDKKAGRLQAYEKIPIKIFFSAETSGQYVRQLQFFIDQAQTDISRCYMKVQVSASACYPTLYFDQPYLILPTVRCGELSTAVLEVFNGGYQNINLKHTVSQQHSNVDLRVKYLTGSNLGVTKKQIKVEVSFISDKPISFTIKLNFYDNNGRFFSINVSGTADTHTYTMIDQDRSNANWAANLEKSCQFLRHYINNTGHLTQQLFEFPKSLIQNEYQKFAIILNNYSPSFEKVKQQVKKNCKTFFSFEYISQVIKILKAEGGFLNHIRPQMLLSFEEYQQNIKIRAEQNATVLGYFKRKDRAQFQLQQKHSWLILFYQLFKVFSRVNPGKLKNNSEFWQKFNAREKIIISWLEKTYLSEAGIDLQTKDNEILTTLNTCEIFSALISKYTSIKILECYGKGVKTQKQKERRCKSVIDTFSQIGINCLFRLQDLLRSNQKEMLLVLQNLYLILPSYLQKGDPIVFSCQFGQIVTKSVQITNPSKYQLTYAAKIQGSKAYSIEGESEFVIDSKKTHEVKIKYISNINLTNNPATLTLTGKANNKFTPSTFVFLLKSNNQGRVSQKTVQVTGNLYEQLDFSIKVTNNFDQDADFKVEMQSNQKNNYQAFYLLSNSIRIKKGETVPLNLIFIPFSLDPQQVFLIFRDEKVGEFQYEVNGLVQCNIFCQEVLRVPQTLFTNKKYTIQLAIPTRNDLLLRARKAAQYLAEKLQKKTTLKDVKQTPAPINYDKYYPKLTNVETFVVKLNTPNNSIVLKTEQIVIKDIELGDDPAKKEQQKLVFDINLKSAIKEGSFTVNLKNIAGTDIRKYKVALTAVSRPLRYELEMKTPANKALTQPLPLINLSQQKNVFHVTLTPANDLARAVFSIDCERETTVETKQQNVINLSFKPRMQSTYNAILKIQNVTSGQNVQYEIIGIAEQPETESVVFDQEVRKQKMYSVKLPITKLTRCNVQSFSIEQASYLKAFQCTPESPFFKFKINPKMSGKIQGKLIIEAQQTLFAYKVIINVKNTIEGEIKLRTVERKEVEGEIALPKGKYSVVCEDRNLKYPEIVQITQLQPNLKLTYYSSKPEEKEVLVTVVSDQVGELTYLIKVIVDPMPQIKIEPFQVELGKVHKELVTFQNTDDKEMTITAKSSHPNIFFAEKQTLKVAPHSKSNNYIVYKASSLQIEQGKILFASDGNAKWTYHLSGYGLPQTHAEVKLLTVMIGEHLCEPITFANPLNKTLPFMISLQNIEGEGAFSTILKSSKMELAYNQQIEIPVTVKPESVGLNTAILKIAINEKIFWRYELRAKTIYYSTEEPKVYKIAARAKVEQPIELLLPFSKGYNGKSVSLNIVNAGDVSDAFLKGAVKLSGGNQAIVLSQKVIYSLNILSYKPKTITTNFQVCAENGCKWIHKVKFVFSAPPIDDQFQIAASINKPSSVKFRLTNRVKAHAKFHAYFTSDSCIDFSVSPKNGELEPYGRQGTAIQVFFCPTQYKKSWSGKLIIETEQSYWSYEVHGVLPHYNPPVGKSTLKQS